MKFIPLILILLLLILLVIIIPMVTTIIMLVIIVLLLVLVTILIKQMCMENPLILTLIILILILYQNIYQFKILKLPEGNVMNNTVLTIVTTVMSRKNQPLVWGYINVISVQDISVVDVDMSVVVVTLLHC